MTLLTCLACRASDPLPDATPRTEDLVLVATGDSGSSASTIPETTTTPGPASRCLPDTTLTLPVPPIEPPPLRWLLGAGDFGTCTDDTWQFPITVGGYGWMFDDNVSEYSIRVQAWDVVQGELVLEVDADFAGTAGRGSFHEFHYWQAEITDPRLTCGDANHLAFTLSGTYAGEPIEPAIAYRENPDTAALYFEGGRIGANVFELDVHSESSDEVWVWVAFPRTLQLFGPFPLARDDRYGWWPFVLDEDLRPLLDHDDSVYLAVGCRDGIVLGSAASNP
jgi:hypothetical protein